MEALRRKKSTIALFVLPSVIAYFAISAFPIFSSFALSFFKWNVKGNQGWIGLKNYIQLFTIDRIFLQSIGHVLYTMVLCAVVQLPLAVLLAFLLNRTKHGLNLFKVSFFIPNMISTVAAGLLWMFVYNYNFGLLNSFLKLLGLENMILPWLGEQSTALTCVVLVACWQYIGYHMIIHLCAMQNIPDSINEAAAIDGASAWQNFWHITLPMLAPILKLDLVLIATGSLRMFDVVFVMTSGGPNHATEMIATHMFTRTFRGLQFGYGSAMAVILTLMCILITILLNVFFRRLEKRAQ